MKFTSIREVTGRFGIRAQAGEYDGRMLLPELWVDKAPSNVTPDRFAVSSVLAFHAHISGEIIFENGISPATAEAISEFMAPVFVAPQPIQFRPIMLPKGTSEFQVFQNESQKSSTRNAIDETRKITVDIKRSDQWAGSMMSFDRLCLSSNSWLFSDECLEEQIIYPNLALAVLFSEDFDIDTIVVDVKISDALKRLLSAARLGIKKI